MTDRKLVFVCSPLSPVLPTGYFDVPHTVEEVAAEKQRLFEENRKQAEEFCRYLAINYDVIPMAPHVYFPRFFDEFTPEERRKGMEMGKQWLRMCDEVAVIGGKVTVGMSEELADAFHMHKPIIPHDNETQKAVDAYVATLVDHFSG